MKAPVRTLLCTIVCGLATFVLTSPSARASGFEAAIDGSSGVISVSAGKQKLLSAVRLVLATGGQTLDQSGCRQASVRSYPDGSAAFTGTISLRGFQCGFEETVLPFGEDLLIRYVICPGSFPDGLEASVHVDVAGQVGDDDAGFAEAPSLRVRTNQDQFWVSRNPAPRAGVEPVAGGFRLAFDFGKPAPGTESGSLILLITRQQPRFPLILSLHHDRDRVPRFHKFELTVDLWADYANPYDPSDIDFHATFTAPSGAVSTTPGFLFQDYLRSQVPDGGKQVERLEPVGERRWKIRFSPQETGTYRYVVRLRTRNGMAPEVRGQFECSASDAPGFVAVSQENGQYFEFSNGDSYFPVGHNVCWVSREGGTFEYERYFEKLHDAGENYTRIWLCSWGLQLEGAALDDYRLDDAWRIDYVLELARQKGIYINFCLDNFHDWTASDKRRFIPYFAENGGPAESIQDFFTNPAALEHYLRRIRYVTARWGYSTHLMAWELWNEMNYLVPDSEPEYVIDWCRRVAQAIRQIDSHGHLVTTSLGADVSWDKLWQSREMDFAQYHAYLSSHSWLAKDEEHDAVGYLTGRFDKLNQYGKPFLAAEWGFHGTNDHNPLNARDRFGLHLHDAIWASALGGAAGTVMPWWWDNYIDPNGLYYHYQAFSRFSAGVNWSRRQWKHVNLQPAPDVRVIGLLSDGLALLWIQNPQNTWYNRLIACEPAPVLSGKVIELLPFRRGRYRVEWWDTYLGGAITSHETVIKGNHITLHLPDCGPDVACKIIRLGD